MYLKTFIEILKHKWFVLCAGLRTGAPLWQLIWHDMSKFSLAEFPHYARKFYGPGGNKLEFGLAWLHHENTNPHHSGYWIPRSGKFKDEPFEMPEKYVREMVADWLGASRSYEGEWPTSTLTWEWFRTHFRGINMHNRTRLLVLDVLHDAGVEVHGYE